MSAAEHYSAAQRERVKLDGTEVLEPRRAVRFTRLAPDFEAARRLAPIRRTRLQS